MKSIQFILLSGVFLFLNACGPRLHTAATQQDTVFVKEIMLDTVLVKEKIEEKVPQELPIFRAEPTRTYNITHTALDLRFDWEKEHVLGKAYLDIKAYFYPTREVVLDAVNFDIHAVKMDNVNGSDIDYEYDGRALSLRLDKDLTRSETRKIYIDYTAKPSEGEAGGSAAIMSDRGLYFINAQGDNPNKPIQIWTQGETQSNSKWFPTFDKPNERTTQEMYITVENKYEILTNGLRVSTTKNKDGTRTEHWEMKTGTGHAPYLFMLTIGEFAVVNDTWRGIPVQYYVEKEYEQDAKIIFPHTPEMIEFFSDILDYPYPWDKYAQVVVRDYISGAMENTTASLFGEFVQKHANELITSPNDGIVAHELIHHWFGNLVTCESWSNIVLNEGFANYSEYLWTEYKYGKEAAQILQAGSRNGYFSTAAQSLRPMVYYEYGHREEVFDANSYNKGGIVFHILRDYLGDELFYSSLNYYLNKNKFSSVEVADLRLAVEKVSGEDMNWFFNQWFHTAGHPILRIEDSYNEGGGTITVTISQEQDPEKTTAIFRLPTKIAIFYNENDIEFHDIIIDKRKQEFTFDVKGSPQAVVVDPEYVLLADKRYNHSVEGLVVLAHASLNAYDRIEAFNSLQYTDTETFRKIRESFLESDIWQIRNAGLKKVDYTDKYASLIETIAAQDDRAEVRINALRKLKSSSDSTLMIMYQAKIDTSFALAEQLVAVEALYKINATLALSIAEELEQKSSSDLIVATLSELYMEENDPKYLPFFRKQIENVSGFSIMNIINNYVELVAQEDAKGIIDNIDFIARQFDKQEGSFFSQIFLAKAIFDIKNRANYSDKLKQEEREQISTYAVDSLNALHEKAQDDRVKGMIERFL